MPNATATSDEYVEEESAAPEPTMVLTFCGRANGGTQRRRVPREGLLFGRGEVVFEGPFEDARMSARHAEVRIEAGRVLLRDLGSALGTRLNGQRLVGDRALEPGDVVRLGDTLMVFAPEFESNSEHEPELVGASAGMVAVRKSIDVVAARKHSVVVVGATGTGKEVVARLVHDRSGRTGPFVPVNCGTFTENLLASDRFGHVRGA